MVYCNLIERNGDEVFYAIGGTTNDLTGKLVINMGQSFFSWD